MYVCTGTESIKQGQRYLHVNNGGGTTHLEIFMIFFLILYHETRNRYTYLIFDINIRNIRP